MRYADSYCSRLEEYAPTHTYTFRGKCLLCGESKQVTVDGKQLFRYRQGEYIQDALTSNTKDEREFLMSGICPNCWGKATNEEEINEDPAF